MSSYQVQFSRSRIVCRAGAVDALASEVEAIGARRLMLVCGTRSAASTAALQVRLATA